MRDFVMVHTFAAKYCNFLHCQHCEAILAKDQTAVLSHYRHKHKGLGLTNLQVATDYGFPVGGGFSRRQGLTS